MVPRRFRTSPELPAPLQNDPRTSWSDPECPRSLRSEHPQSVPERSRSSPERPGAPQNVHGAGRRALRPLSSLSCVSLSPALHHRSSSSPVSSSPMLFVHRLFVASSSPDLAVLAYTACTAYTLYTACTAYTNYTAYAAYPAYATYAAYTALVPRTLAWL